MELSELEENFALFDDWTERYQYIIDLGRKLPPFDDALRTEENQVRGCVSQVWLVCRRDDGDPPRFHFEGDSDASIVKGLFAILREIYSGRTAEEIQAIDLPGLFARIGLESHLSPNRRNGFFSMVEKIRAQAAGTGD